jgi:hypothetical protein
MFVALKALHVNESDITLSGFNWKNSGTKAKKMSAILATGDDFTSSILVSGHKTICGTFASSIKSIIAINIEFPFDCCIIQAGQLIRRDRKCKT